MLGETGTHRGLSGGPRLEDVDEGAIDKSRMAEALGLSLGEHLVVWALRRLVARRGLDQLTMMEFKELCGPGAPQVLATFQGFLAIAGHASRHPVNVGYPGYVGLTMDERHLVALLSAAQAGETDRFSAHLRFMSRPETREDLGIAANGLAAIFAAHGLEFGPPAMPPTTPRALDPRSAVALVR
ncbi:MAG TPA: hypothetical protein VL574_05180 [Stellaceae bacterium]|nr:hypothetical protein [Stellaceae bacterium]